MECKHHPGVAAVDRCAGCAEPFCYNCLVDIQGRKYCAQCKVLALQGRMPPPMAPGYGAQTCPEAKEALILSIVGWVCCVLLQIWTLIKAAEAKRKIDANPYLTGRGMATAAQVLAIIQLVVFALYVMAMIATEGRLADM